jgi:lipid-binding SYLF domain-containing protein
MTRRAVFCACVLFLLPLCGSAGPLWDSVKDGASKVKERVNDTVETTKESLGDEETPEATRAKLDAMADETLSRLFAENTSARDLFEQSAGYAVFDMRQITFKLAAGYGRGVAVDKEADTRAYMKMATGGLGLSFGLGGFDTQLIILFERPDDLQDFMEKGYDAKAEASQLQGEERTELAARFTDGTAVFVLTEKGWKVAANVTGTRYWRDRELN